MGMHVAVGGTGLLTRGVGRHGALWTSTGPTGICPAVAGWAVARVLFPPFSNSY